MGHFVPKRQEILLVDDEEDTLLELQEMLEDAGFVCHLATSVQVAMQQLNRFPDIALIITDLRMPEESGLRLLQRLRSGGSNQNIPVIVSSGHAGIDDVIDVLRLQVVDFLRKPIYHEQLIATLDNLFPPEAYRDAL